MSQKLLCELFHEDNIDGVLFHQDAVVLKGSNLDDASNFTGSLFLIQQRPVGQKRRLRVALPQPHYVLWIPYTYLYCLASHLLSAGARRAIDAEADVGQLAAMMVALKATGSTAAHGPASEPEPPQRLEWAYTICLPVSQIDKMVRKSNLRGRRIIQFVRRENHAVEAPLIFEEGGMTKFIEELRRVAKVDPNPYFPDELRVSNEKITASAVAPSPEEAPLAASPPVHFAAAAPGADLSPSSTSNTASERALANATPTGSDGAAARTASKGGGFQTPSQSPLGGGAHGGANTNTGGGPTASNTSFNSSLAGSSIDVYEYVDPATLREQLYNDAGFATRPSRVGSQPPQQQQQQHAAPAAASKARGVMSAMLSFGAQLTRGTQKVAAAATTAPPSGNQRGSHNHNHNHHQDPEDAKAGKRRTARQATGGYASDEYDNISESDFAAGGSGTEMTAAVEDRHREPMPPVLRMPAISRKMPPPLPLGEWVAAFQDCQPGHHPAGDDAPATRLPATIPALPERPCVPAPETRYGGIGTLAPAGQSTAFHQLRVKAYNGCVSDECRPQVWAYLLGVFAVGDTVEQRAAKLRGYAGEYQCLRAQWHGVFPAQEAHFTKFREHRVAVDKDVIRTDRGHPDFKEDDSARLVQLREILMSYAMLNFDLGYCQGMSDILAVLLMVFGDDEVVAYAAFRNLLAAKLEKNFRLDVKRCMERHLRTVEVLVKRFVPDLYHYLVEQGAESMIFTFRWLLILFKREFEISSVIRLWDVIFACPFTDDFEVVVVAAILKSIGPQIVEQELAYDEILKFANGVAGAFDVADVIMLSQDFYSLASQTASQVRRGTAAAAMASGAFAGAAPGAMSGKMRLEEIVAVLESEMPPSPTSS